MNKETSISAILHFHFGSKIFCTDGEDGTLLQVVFDSATRSITHISVKQGRLFGKTAYLPFESIVNATGEGVTLRVKRADVTTASASNTQSTSSGVLLDHKSSVVVANSGAKGTLTLVAAQPGNGELAYIVAHHLHPRQDTLLRTEFVTELANGQVTVTISDEELKALPPYRPDSELQQEVEDILFELTPLHIDMKGLNLRVLDSVLYLEGNISSTLRADLVMDQVMGIPGLVEIKNNLIADDTLANELAMALGRDPRTRDLPIGVYPRLGDVRLSGSVHTGQQKSTADEIARNFPGVRSVINSLLVDPASDILHVMAEPEGGETEDKVPGKYVRHTK